VVEAVVGWLLPPACRESVLGDLHERYSGLGPYVAEAARTVPMVIWSRIRRTADGEVLLMEAFSMYLSFVAVGWYFEGIRFLNEKQGMARVAAPVVAAMGGLVLADAYAPEGERGKWRAAGEAATGVAFALLTENLLWALWPGIAVSGWVMAGGCGLSLLMVSGLRLLFPPGSRPKGAR